MLDVAGVRKSYGDIVALRGVDLQIDAGEIVGLVGPNGAGKSTLVSMIAGLLSPDAGTIAVAGADVHADPKRAHRMLGLAPQELGLYPTITVRDNLAMFGALAGVRGPTLRSRIEEAAELFKITEFLGRPARQLSGGEKRRVHTAMAMLHRPPLLLLDEPTAGVDVHTRADVLSAVRHLAAEGSAVCYSTHYLAEVESLGASVAIIERGEFVSRGEVADLIRAHGLGALELTFNDSPPELQIPERYDIVGDRLRVQTDEPAIVAARILAALGERTASLRSIEILSPSLEAVFLTLTGRRYHGSDDRNDGRTDELPA